jgi:rubrerythrin
MDEAAKEVARALFEAIKAESDGESFYKMAALSAEDDKGRQVFEQLAGEELDHKRFLTAQYRSVRETGKVDAGVKLGRRADLSGASPIFSEHIKARLRDAHLEMSALSIGIQLEQTSMGYYREQAERAADPQVRQLFEELADWERGHYEALLRQQESLKDDYWHGGGFSPF